ncbi:glutaredoxin family protein [Pseudoalteromonas pernae]|uniref:glutaredoxin family protein n=1 Tax=Pseudoalteromonas pernae TaxID=3118054 RepID=UPI003242EDAE
MAKVVLYHTDGCHLCEQAYELLSAHELVDSIEQRDIINDAAWLEAYQIRIPVLALAESSQSVDLGWPFDYQSVTKFLKQYGSN